MMGIGLDFVLRIWKFRGFLGNRIRFVRRGHSGSYEHSFRRNLREVLDDRS
jgi:hypothetical protein